MIDYINTLPKIVEDKKGSGVLILANDILNSGDYWCASDIRNHLDCSGKRAADYIDNIVKSKRYTVDVLNNPRRIKVVAINKQSKSTKIKNDLLVLATAIKEHGGFWSRKDIKSFLVNNNIVELYEAFPCEIAHRFYVRMINNKNIITEVMANPPKLKIIEIEQ
jgi:hypothetical protein